MKKFGPLFRGITIHKVFFPLFFFIIGLCHSAAANSQLPIPESISPTQSLTLSVQYGTPIHIWSDRLYSPFQLATLSLTWEKESGLWPFTKNKDLVKSFMLEFRLSHIWGRGIELDEDQVSPEVWNQARQEGRTPTVDWDHYQIALIPYYRFYYPITEKSRFYFQAGFGFSLLDRPLIEDGTTWNFLVCWGIGMDFKTKTPFNLFLGMQHFSNGGDANLGITDKRVIGPENLVFGLGFRFPL